MTRIEGSLNAEAGPWRRSLALLAIALTAWACGGEPEPANEEAEDVVRPVAVRSATPAVEEVVDRAVLSADLLPHRRAVLAAEVAGAIERLTFESGDAVRRGQLLAAIDTRTLEQAVTEAEALARQAREQAERAEALFERRAITREALIDATAGRDVAAARLASAELQLSKSMLRAPWSGRIAAKRTEVGDYAAPGQPVAELVDVRRLKVRAAAPAVDVPFLSVGAPIEIRVDVLPGEVFTGELIRLGAELDRGARTLDVEAELDNRDGRLKPGMFARLEVVRRTYPDALLVPLAAVVDLGSTDVVYVVEGDRARRRDVETGPSVDSRVVVLSGLEASDRVVIEGAQQIADGQLLSEAPN